MSWAGGSVLSSPSSSLFAGIVTVKDKINELLYKAGGLPVFRVFMLVFSLQSPLP